MALSEREKELKEEITQKLAAALGWKEDEDIASVRSDISIIFPFIARAMRKETYLEHVETHSKPFCDIYCPRAKNLKAISEISDPSLFL